MGFPGETPEDLEETIDVVRTVKFDNAFTFIYSKRTGTPAAAMENQVPEEQVRENFDRLLGRLSNNMIVHVPGDALLIGKTVRVSLDECRGFYYMGTILDL